MLNFLDPKVENYFPALVSVSHSFHERRQEKEGRLSSLCLCRLLSVHAQYISGNKALLKVGKNQVTEVDIDESEVVSKP